MTMSDPVIVKIALDAKRLARIVTERGRSGPESPSADRCEVTFHAPADPGWELWAAIQADEIDARQSRSRRHAMAFGL